MKKKIVSGSIVTTNDLKTLQEKNPGALVVGVTKSGTIYKLEGEQAVGMDVSEAAIFLDMHEDFVRELQANPNAFKFPIEGGEEKTPETLERINESREEKNEVKSVITNLVDEITLPTHEPVPPEEYEPHVATDKERIERLEIRVKHLLEANDKLEEEKSKVITTLTNLVESLLD